VAGDTITVHWLWLVGFAEPAWHLTTQAASLPTGTDSDGALLPEILIHTFSL
jgi:hypothetical protein